MPRAVVVVPVLLGSLLGSLLGTGRAETGRDAPPMFKPPTPVLGGTSAPAGKWPDIVAMPFDGSPDSTYCTGTLIAPTVVITAHHCVVEPPPPDNVLIGTSSLAQPEAGELINIQAIHAYPDGENTLDLAVLVLATPSTRAPRPIATGWARADILDGAGVALVGYGAIDAAAETYIPELQEAMSTITDAGCTKNAANGCNAMAAPAGELGAGGMGIDTCLGDSGGPLYLVTGYGTFLAGVTSRSYDDATLTCSEGGIYARPDKAVEWIERVSGVTIARGPEPAADAIVAAAVGGETVVTANDPRSESHSYAIARQPANGTAGVRDDGHVLVCPTAAGADTVIVTLIDATNPARKAELTIPITADAAATSCSVEDFLDTGGCCDSGRNAGGSVPLAIGLAAILRRRRRTS
ncbi:MAG: trypsin-like serine protease [Deltaproteobacteria bacterium]|nr:trypsin-like serine protease [Deltaproteobacteria bacterium]